MWNDVNSCERRKVAKPTFWLKDPVYRMKVQSAGDSIKGQGRVPHYSGVGWSSCGNAKGRPD